MRTFWIDTLGCKVNHYESEQLRAQLQSRGLTEAAGPAAADLRLVHSCSVTTEAASKSRSAVRKGVRLNVLHAGAGSPGDANANANANANAGTRPPVCENGELVMPPPSSPSRPRVVVTGCWATSDPHAARAAGADAVLGHQTHVAAELDRLLSEWTTPRSPGLDGQSVGAPVDAAAAAQANALAPADPPPARSPGMTSLPLLGEHQDSRQRAFLKVQDGCDAHCTYCIIPKLRSTVWSKPIEDAVREATRLVAAGHVEIVLTGIFLGAYGQPTALRRRQLEKTHGLARLIESLCRIPGLARLRLSSLEPGDLDDDLLEVLAGHRQVMPHFHLPLQSGSDDILRRMNRQYGRTDFLRMVDRVKARFDRPALTTDIIVGFPGETDAACNDTVDIARRTGFIHIHAFPFSPRPGTAAARWEKDFVRGPLVRRRIQSLESISAEYSIEYRRQFVGETVYVLVERKSPRPAEAPATPGRRHGRCERYFDVSFDAGDCQTGDLAAVRVDLVDGPNTLGTLVSSHHLHAPDPAALIAS
jgi:threonylcarbamoyladenosine tRNA methylthiotransferase MtaB